jgi:hypothetical protein
MNHFELFAHGVSFDPKEYLASTKLVFDKVWYKGEEGHDHPKSSGVGKSLGNGPSLPIFEQERIAIEYLVKNNHELKSLANFPGVTTFILGLQYHIELDESTIGFCMGPSHKLMKCALDLGIDPTYYVTIDHQCEHIKNGA